MMLRSLRFIFKPSHWNRIYPYSEVWDAHVRDAIAAGDIVVQNQYTALVGGVRTWIENYPYSFGHSDVGINVMPSRDTVVALHNAVLRAMFEKARGENG